MKGIVQKECSKLIKSYHTTKQDKRKIDYRNKLFEIMLTQMQIWIKSILGKWGIHRSPEEILSLSWDAFMFCLDKYDIPKNTPIPIYFYSFTRYFLLIHFAKEQGVTVPLEELVDTLELVNSDENIMFGRLLRMHQIRCCLPGEHQFVWDDAYRSLDPADQYKKAPEKFFTLTKNTYYNLKRSYVSIITFLLKG